MVYRFFYFTEKGAHPPSPLLGWLSTDPSPHPISITNLKGAMLLNLLDRIPEPLNDPLHDPASMDQRTSGDPLPGACTLLKERG